MRTIAGLFPVKPLFEALVVVYDPEAVVEDCGRPPREFDAESLAASDRVPDGGLGQRGGLGRPSLVGGEQHGTVRREAGSRRLLSASSSALSEAAVSNSPRHVAIISCPFQGDRQQGERAGALRASSI
jgi:hypothetical protein